MLRDFDTKDSRSVGSPLGTRPGAADRIREGILFGIPEGEKDGMSEDVFDGRRLIVGAIGAAIGFADGT